MKKYIVVSHLILVVVIAFLVYANYLKAPSVEQVKRLVSIADEIKMVDSIASTYKGVVFAEEEIPNCCTSNYAGEEFGQLQTVMRHKNGMTKFALSWEIGQDFSLKYNDVIMYFGEDGRPVSYRFHDRWHCFEKVKGFEHLVENPEACLNIK